MEQYEQDATIESIIRLSREIEEIGTPFRAKALYPLLEKAGAKLVGSVVGGSLYKFPVEEDCVLLMTKQLYFSMELGRERENGSFDVSFPTKLEMFNLHGKTALQKLVQIKHTLESIDPSTAMEMYKGHIQKKMEMERQRKIAQREVTRLEKGFAKKPEKQRKEEQRELEKEERLMRRIMRREVTKTEKGLIRRLMRTEKIKKVEKKDVVPKEVKPQEPPKKIKTVEEDFSIYDASGVNFRHLINSSYEEIRQWAKELKAIQNLYGDVHSDKDKYHYISQLKELHSKVSDYHNIKCKGIPPTNCAWKCDIWNLLHLCLYLMEESSKLI